MLPGDLVSGDVVAFVTRVVVNGIDRPAVSVSLSGEMRSDLPSQISRAGSSMRRGGTVEWATSADVAGRPVTAFRDFGVWRPQKGDTIIVYAGDGVTEWRRFTGLVDETTGSFGEGMRSTIVADLDPFSRSFSSEPLLTRMYPRPGSSTWRMGGLSPFVTVDQVLRRGGRFITPPTVSGSVLNVPYQTTMRPAMGGPGSLIQGGRHTGVSLFQADMPAPWGFGAGNFIADYEPSQSKPLSTPTQLSVMVGPQNAGIVTLTLRYGAHYIRLSIFTNGNIVLQVSVNSTLHEVCRLTASQMVGAYRVEILVKDGQGILRANNNAMASGMMPSGMGNPSLERVEVNARPDACIAGLQVYHPATTAAEWATLNREPSARILTTYGHVFTWAPIQATPRYEPQYAINALENLADETLSALWVDEYGVLMVAPSGALRNTGVSQTITTADDVLGFSWSDRLLSSATEIVVRYQVAHLSYAMRQAIEVARGSKKSLTRTEVAEDVYRPPADEDWYGVDDTPSRLPNVGWGAYNRREGSFVGVTYTQDGGPIAEQTQYSTSISMTKTGISEWSIRHEVGNMPDNVVAETITHPVTTYLWSRNRDNSLPVLTAWAKAVWIDRETSVTTGRPGPVLNVDMGAGTASMAAEDTRDYLLRLIQNAHPRITNMPVTPDPRRQLGDHILINSQNFLGVTLRCLITGISERITPDGYEQHLDLDVLNVSTGSLTYEEWEQAFPGTLTYSQWQALRDATDTYDDFNTDPLKGA